MNRRKKVALVSSVFGVVGVMTLALWAAQGKAQLSKATYTIKGLHCGACVDAVQGALKKTTGVSSTRVSLEEGIATINYDSGKASVQSLSRLIDATPSPMPKSEFKSALVLKVEKVKTSKDEGAVLKALSSVKGVSNAGVNQDNGLFLVTFGKEGNAGMSQLTEALQTAGYKAKAWTPGTVSGSGGNHNHSGGSSGGGCGGSHGNHSSQGGGGCCGGGGGGGTATRAPQTGAAPVYST